MQTNDLKQKRNMEKEKTERAAIELCTTEGQEEWVKDYGVSCFMDGARWRINSVWHDVREQPEQDKCFIYEIGDGRYEIDCIYKKEKLNWERYAAQLNIIRWAYVDDLLPERKEVAR